MVRFYRGDSGDFFYHRYPFFSAPQHLLPASNTALEPLLLCTNLKISPSGVEIWLHFQLCVPQGNQSVAEHLFLSSAVQAKNVAFTSLCPGWLGAPILFCSSLSAPNSHIAYTSVWTQILLPGVSLGRETKLSVGLGTSAPSRQPALLSKNQGCSMTCNKDRIA